MSRSEEGMGCGGGRQVRWDVGSGNKRWSKVEKEEEREEQLGKKRKEIEGHGRKEDRGKRRFVVNARRAGGDVGRGRAGPTRRARRRRAADCAGTSQGIREP